MTLRFPNIRGFATWGAVLLIAIGALPGHAAAEPIFFQAHRGTVDEAPENTMAAFHHAWKIAGAVPEVDVRTTSDDVLICMHDETPARTTNAPAASQDKKISEIVFATLRTWDAGAWFSTKHTGEKVPALRELFAAMQGHPEKRLYLDLKGVDLDALKKLIEEYGVIRQVLFVHGTQAKLIEVQHMFPGGGTMTWLSGSPRQIQAKFEALAETDFKGITQLQFHLNGRRKHSEIIYRLSPDFLTEAEKRLRAAGVALQLRPLVYDAPSLRALMDLGVHWYVTDAPEAFAHCVREAQTL